MKIHTEKLSISLPVNLIDFVKDYQVIHSYKSKSEVFQDALKLLRKKELEREYALANEELNSDFDSTLNDGLEDETW